MNKQETAKELEDFVSFNVTDIKNLYSESKELGDAFMNVLNAISKQYANNEDYSILLDKKQEEEKGDKVVELEKVKQTTIPNAKYKEGDIVELIQHGKIYPSDTELFKQFGFKNINYNDYSINGRRGKIFGVGLDSVGNIVYAVSLDLFEPNNATFITKEIIVGEGGIEKIKQEFDINDIVNVIDSGEEYESFSSMFEKLGFKNNNRRTLKYNPLTEFIIFNKAWNPREDEIVYAIRNNNQSEEYLFSEKGLKLVKKGTIGTEKVKQIDPDNYNDLIGLTVVQSSARKYVKYKVLSVLKLNPKTIMFNTEQDGKNVKLTIPRDLIKPILEGKIRSDIYVEELWKLTPEERAKRIKGSEQEFITTQIKSLKVGDKVKLPLTKSYGDEYNDSNAIKEAKKLNQPYLYVGIIKGDAITLWYKKEKTGDKFSILKDKIELYEEPATTQRPIKVGDKVKLPLTKSIGNEYNDSTAIKEAKKLNQPYLYVGAINGGIIRLWYTKQTSGDTFLIIEDKIELYEEPAITQTKTPAPLNTPQTNPPGIIVTANTGNRPSPTASANDVKAGVQVIGNDGKWWVSAQSANGKFNRWVLMKPQPTTQIEDDYSKMSQDELKLKKEELLEVLKNFDETEPEYQEAKIELDEINLYIK